MSPEAIVQPMTNESLREAVKLWFDDNNECLRQYGHITHWDTSQITDMNRLFRRRYSFDEPLLWNTQYVTNMSYMFHECRSYNQPITLNTENVTNMTCMFRKCLCYNQKTLFDTRNVVSMCGMFYGCKVFNQSLDFNTQNVESMCGMFYNCEMFDQKLNFDMSNITNGENIANMFHGCTYYRQPVYHLNINTSIRDMINLNSRLYLELYKKM